MKTYLDLIQLIDAPDEEKKFLSDELRGAGTWGRLSRIIMWRSSWTGRPYLYWVELTDALREMEDLAGEEDVPDRLNCH